MLQRSESANQKPVLREEVWSELKLNVYKFVQVKDVNEHLTGDSLITVDIKPLSNINDV